MTKSWVWPAAIRAGYVLVGLLVASSSTINAQVLNTDQEIHVSGLPSLLSRTHDLSDVLPTSIDTILHDPSICCGKDSALEDSVAAADPLSLKDVSGKLQGRHLLSDGRPIQVTADFWPSAEVNSGQIIGALADKNALLMSWNSHLYVVHGAIYQWIWVGGDETGSKMTTLHKLLLLDTRYSDERRHIEFNRETDDLTNVQGFLLLQWKLQ